MSFTRIRILSVLFAVGCSSAPIRNLENIHTGMDKDEVLEQAGDPKRTFRSNGKDHWIYIYFQNDKEHLRDVVFLDGRVHQVGKSVERHGLERSLDNTETLEEFEAKAREFQKNKSSGHGSGK